MDTSEVAITGVLCTTVGAVIGAVLNFLHNRKQTADNKYIALNAQTIDLTKTILNTLRDQILLLQKVNEELSKSVMDLTRENEKLRDANQVFQDENLILKLTIEDLERKRSDHEQRLIACETGLQDDKKTADKKD